MKNISRLYYKDYFRGLSFNGSEADKRLLKNKNSEILNTPFFRIENPLAQQTIEFKVNYPGLVTGTGINHEASIEGEFKLGIHFNYTYGMPVIYGSSVKGVLRSAFPEKGNDQWRKEKLHSIKGYLKKAGIVFPDDNTIDLLRDQIFEGIENKKNISTYKRDIFFDAVIIRPVNRQIAVNGRTQTVQRILDADSITPHDKNPLKNPVPITFLKIASGVTMEFRFDLKPCTIEGVEISANQKRDFFKDILSDFGIGAKTSVGYGQFQ